MSRFDAVGIGKDRENYIALSEAQELTNSRAEVFHVFCDGCEFDGLISTVGPDYFGLQLLNGSQIEGLSIEKLEKIELVDRWNLKEKTAYRIYLDDIRETPEGYMFSCIPAIRWEDKIWNVC